MNQICDFLFNLPDLWRNDDIFIHCLAELREMCS